MKKFIAILCLAAFVIGGCAWVKAHPKTVAGAAIGTVVGGAAGTGIGAAAGAIGTGAAIGAGAGAATGTGVGYYMDKKCPPAQTQWIAPYPAPAKGSYPAPSKGSVKVLYPY